MTETPVLDHLSMTVSDYARSKSFYTAALKPLGITLMLEFGKDVTGTSDAAGFGRGKPYFWIGSGKATGPIHVAFGAASRADVDAFQLVLGRDLAFQELSDLALGLAQLFCDLACEFPIDLHDLQLGLGDLAIGLSTEGNELRPLAVEPCRLAFEFEWRPPNQSKQYTLHLHDLS